MRILMTTDTVGGVWTFTSELTRELLQRGHTVHLVSFGRQPSHEQQALADRLSAKHQNLFRFTTSTISLEWMQENERAHADGEQLILEFLRADKCDLVLANQFCFGRLDTDIPRVVVAHSDVLSWARACKPSTLDGSPWLNRYTSMVQAGILSATALTTPTVAMGKALKSSYFMPSNYVLIPNGVSIEAPVEPEPIRKLQTITAGRLWDEAKGLDTLSTLNVPMPLLIAGDNTFESSEQQTSWPAHLLKLGPLDRAELHQRFRESAIYLCASRYEPFGLAPLEAALCGCAIVARDLPSLREVWEDNALYFHDQTSLEKTLRALANDPNLLAEGQRRARHRASLFTPERMTDAYLHVFDLVLKLTSQASPHVA